jgi:hypothetical protein
MIRSACAHSLSHVTPEQDGQGGHRLYYGTNDLCQVDPTNHDVALHRVVTCDGPYKPPCAHFPG